MIQLLPIESVESSFTGESFRIVPTYINILTEVDNFVVQSKFQIFIPKLLSPKHFSHFITAWPMNHGVISIFRVKTFVCGVEIF